MNFKGVNKEWSKRLSSFRKKGSVHGSRILSESMTELEYYCEHGIMPPSNFGDGVTIPDKMKWGRFLIYPLTELYLHYASELACGTLNNAAPSLELMAQAFHVGYLCQLINSHTLCSRRDRGVGIAQLTPDHVYFPAYSLGLFSGQISSRSGFSVLLSKQYDAGLLHSFSGKLYHGYPLMTFLVNLAINDGLGRKPKDYNVYIKNDVAEYDELILAWSTDDIDWLRSILCGLCGLHTHLSQTYRGDIFDLSVSYFQFIPFEIFHVMALRLNQGLIVPEFSHPLMPVMPSVADNYVLPDDYIIRRVREKMQLDNFSESNIVDKI